MLKTDLHGAEISSLCAARKGPPKVLVEVLEASIGCSVSHPKLGSGTVRSYRSNRNELCVEYQGRSSPTTHLVPRTFATFPAITVHLVLDAALADRLAESIEAARLKKKAALLAAQRLAEEERQAARRVMEANGEAAERRCRYRRLASRYGAEAVYTEYSGDFLLVLSVLEKMGHGRFVWVI